jgi:hypothetical protein
MALEQAGNYINIKRLKERMKKRFPDYNFDVKPDFDRECKSKYDCQGMSNVTYYDQEGNYFCGKRYKQAHEDNPYKWEYKECHALLKEAEQGNETTELPF